MAVKSKRTKTTMPPRSTFKFKWGDKEIEVDELPHWIAALAVLVCILVAGAVVALALKG